MALGQYPYPPETYSNVFAQLTAIVHGDPPELPESRYSAEARDWVSRCLAKQPEARATYAELLKVGESPLTVLDGDFAKKRYKAYGKWLRGKSLFKQQPVD